MEIRKSCKRTSNSRSPFGVKFRVKFRAKFGVKKAKKKMPIPF